ncbi:TOG domain-containing protein [Trichostrongylus colubriformis]|uniref:TOG domain-containing protein n=1 Tax=Trichostrongylus colubriformis TaxID=6319 RepID=A0AAN8G552_TRICO
MDSLLDPMRLRPDRLPSPAFMPRDDDYAELLRSNDFDVRLQTLNRLAALSRRDPDWFSHCARKGELFKNIDRILSDDRWEVQHQCIKFLYEAMPTFGSNLEYCVCYLMPNLLPKLGNSKITVRKISIQAIQAFLRLQPEALGSMLKTLSNFLLTSTERTTKTDVIREFPAMFLPELLNSDWSNLLDTLTKLMGTSDGETAESAAITAKKLEVYLGKATFERLLLSLPSAQQKDYARFSKNIVVAPADAVTMPFQVVSRNNFKLVSGERRFRFGIVPSVIAAMVIDNTDAVTRIAGLEKWKQLIENITNEEISRLVPHLHSYLMSLGNVLTELNFKVIVLALDVVRLTVNRLKSHIDAHLQQVVSLLAQHFGNQKAVIKQLIMMTCMDLFQNINPKAVVGALCVYLENRNSRVREEVVNILTSALMTTSSSKINFTAVLNVLIPLLIDPKRRVRLAAFEQLSVVGYLMNGKVDILLRSVREAETRHAAKGLSNAVMARLRRQTLPRIRYDGLIEYSTPPVNDCSFGVSESQLSEEENLDLNWILHGGESMPNRPISPMSIAGITKAFIATKSQKAALPWINEKDDATCAMTMDRMKSDDQIVRRQDANAILNPNLSTSSWHTPKRNNSLISEDRSVSAAISRIAQRNAEAAPVPNGEATAETVNRKELNNNHLPIRNHISSSPPTLAKAKSEGNLVEERENNPPANYDDVPIKPAKGGQYFDGDLTELSNGTVGYGSLAKKSTSHHSLPVTTTHASLKHVKSTPVRKQQSTVKVLPSAQSKSPSKVAQTIPARSAQNLGSKTVANALKKIESEDWNHKVEGINMISDLSATNPKEVSDHMHEVVLAILNECKNLRSSVSRVALACAGTLTQNMRGKMDMELDKLCMILINKAGDVSNAFIREDASEALTKVVNYASAGKALQAIITAGSKSKNNTIRASCASFVVSLVSRLGTATVLSSPDQLAKLVTQLLAFSRDPNPVVRMHGKQTIVNLSQDPNFDRQMKKAISDSEYRAVKAILDEIDKKGLDSLDNTCASLGSSLSRSGSMRKAVQRKLPDNVQLDLDEIRADLTAAGWERRLGGLKRFEEMSTSATRIVASDTKLIEAFIGRLNDINSKVSLEGLDTYLVTLPSLNRSYSTEAHLKAVLNQLVLALMSHLSSKSDDHRKSAQKCLSETIKRVDPASLSPAIAAATRKANIKQKPFMLNIFSRLNIMLYPSKPKQVEVVALPILWECLRAGLADSDMKKAVTEFAKGLVGLMGERALLDQASMELDPTRRKLLESLIR